MQKNDKPIQYDETPHQQHRPHWQQITTNQTLGQTLELRLELRLRLGRELGLKSGFGLGSRLKLGLALMR